MSEMSPGDVTRLLHRWRGGDDGAWHELVPVVYQELKKLARQRIRREPRGQSLQPTELVNEMYLRLAGGVAVPWRDRAHFLAVSAIVMRRVLVDRARQKKSRNAEGRVSLDPARLPTVDRELDMLSLDEALRDLAAVAPRQARAVELRFFGGLTNTEMAEVLDLSEATVKRDLADALARLGKTLRR